MLAFHLFVAVLVIALCRGQEGYLTTLAGSTIAYGLQDGIGGDVRFYLVTSLALSHDESTVYIVDYYNHMIRLYLIETGQVLHWVGHPSSGFADGVGPYARFRHPYAVALHPFHNYLLVVDTGNNCIRRADTVSATVTTVAGNGIVASIDGYGTSSSLNGPYGLAIDPTGAFALIVDRAGHKLRRLDLVTFALVTLAGNGNAGYALGSGPYVYLRSPVAIVVSNNFALFADENYAIYKLDLLTNVVSLFCGTPGVYGWFTGPCSSARFYNIRGLTLSKDMSRVYVSDSGSRVLYIDMASRYVHHVVGNGYGTMDGPAAVAQMQSLYGLMLAPDESGIFISDRHSLRYFGFAGQPPTRAPTSSPYDTTGQVKSFAGTTFKGYQDDMANFAMFNSPHKLVMTQDGNTALVCDTMNHVIRAVDVLVKEAYTLVGSGVAGFANGVGTIARFNQPTHIVMHLSQDVAYFTDRHNHRIRALKVAGKEVSTLAGTGTPGHLDATGTSATLHFPTGIAIDSSGNYLLFTETGSHLLRKIDLITKAVVKLAGQTIPGFATGVGTVASFNTPWGVAISSSGVFALVADSQNNMIRRVDLVTMQVSNYCGWLYAGRTTGECEVARFSNPHDVALVHNDSIAIVADSGNLQLRYIDMSSRRVAILAGSGGAGSSDGPRLTATLNSATGVTMRGNVIYFADASSNKLRSMEMPLLAIPTVAPTRAPTRLLPLPAHQLSAQLLPCIPQFHPQALLLASQLLELLRH